MQTKIPFVLAITFSLVSTTQLSAQTFNQKKIDALSQLQRNCVVGSVKEGMNAWQIDVVKRSCLCTNSTFINEFWPLDDHTQFPEKRFREIMNTCQKSVNESAQLELENDLRQQRLTRKQ